MVRVETIVTNINFVVVIKFMYPPLLLEREYLIAHKKF